MPPTRALWHTMEYLSEMEVVSGWSRWEVRVQEASEGAGTKVRIHDSSSSIGRSVKEMETVAIRLM